MHYFQSECHSHPALCVNVPTLNADQISSLPSSCTISCSILSHVKVESASGSIYYTKL